MSESWPRPLPAKQLELFGLTFDLRLVLALIVSTTLITLDYYFTVLPAETYAGALRAKAVERTLYYLAAPLLLVFAFGDRPADYGFRLGRWKHGLALAGGSALLAAPLLLLAARSPTMVEYYAQAERGVVEVLWVSALDLFGWEFLFRGFLLVLLGRLLGPSAIVLQAVPFALAHLGKPPLETLTTIFGGTYFGFVAWRSHSFLYAFLLHWLINITVVLGSLYAGGQITP